MWLWHQCGLHLDQEKRERQTHRIPFFLARHGVDAFGVPGIITTTCGPKEYGIILEPSPKNPTTNRDISADSLEIYLQS